MKRLAALFAAFCLIASPALATTISQIAGAGTGGSLGTGTTGAGNVQFSTSAMSANVPAGSLIVVTVSHRSGTTTGWSCTDTATVPNTYSVVGPVASNTTTGTAIFYAIAGASGNFVSGTTVVKCTLAAAQNGAINVYAFSGVNATPLDQSGNNGAGSAATALSPVPAAATAALACNSTAGEVVVGNLIGQNALTNGGIGTGWTAGPVLQDSISAWQILNSNAGVQWINSVTQTSGAWEGQVAVFKTATCGSGVTVHGLLLIGVGQ